MAAPITFTANYSATDSAGNAVTGTVTGATATATTPPPPAPPVISSIVLAPSSEAVSTPCTLTVTATGTAPLACAVTPIPGLTFLPVSGQPAGKFVFNFTAPSAAGSTAINATVTDGNGMKASASSTLTTTAASSAWPTASSTGYGTTTLTPATSNSLNVAGKTYSGLSFTNTVSISASNITLKNCKITIPASAPWALGVSGGLKGITIQNCTIVGNGSAGGTAVYGFYLQGNSQVMIDSCDISQVGQCAINGGQVTITNNYIHDLHSGSGTHYEDIYYGGAGGSDFSLLIQGNSMSNPNNQTASIYLENYFGVLQNVTVDKNLLIGGDYTIYVEGNQNANNVLNIKVTNNALGAGIYGYINANKGKAPTFQAAISGNYDYLTKAPVGSVANPN